MKTSQLFSKIVLLGMAGLFAIALPAKAQVVTILYNFDSSTGELPLFFGRLAQGRDGNLYGMTNEGGKNGSGVVFRITPAGTLKVLHGFDLTNGGLPAGGVTLATDGNFYGTTVEGGSSNYGVLFKLTLSGYTVLHNFSGPEGQNPGSPQSKLVTATCTEQPRTVAGTAIFTSSREEANTSTGTSSVDQLHRKHP
jgi:uncharacterized repeat protein (TIGR03803 family)